jgi:hypothetical protein
MRPPSGSASWRPRLHACARVKSCASCSLRSSCSSAAAQARMRLRSSTSSSRALSRATRHLARKRAKELQRNLFSIGDWKLRPRLPSRSSSPSPPSHDSADATRPRRSGPTKSTLTEATMHAGQEFGEGWLVAYGQWSSLQGKPAANGDRTYVILPEVVILNVNSMLPVATPVIFNAANKNARQRRARGGGFKGGFQLKHHSLPPQQLCLGEPDWLALTNCGYRAWLAPRPSRTSAILIMVDRR